MDANEDEEPAGAGKPAATRRAKLCICARPSCPALADPSLKFVRLPIVDGPRSTAKKVFNRRRWLVHLGMTEARLPDVKHHFISLGHFHQKDFDSNVAFKRWTDGTCTSNAADVFKDEKGKRQTLSVPSVTLEEIRGERRQSGDRAVASLDRARERREPELAEELQRDKFKRVVQDAGIDFNSLTPTKKLKVVEQVGQVLEKRTVELDAARKGGERAELANEEAKADLLACQADLLACQAELDALKEELLTMRQERDGLKVTQKIMKKQLIIANAKAVVADNVKSQADKAKIEADEAADEATVRAKKLQERYQKTKDKLEETKKKLDKKNEETKENTRKYRDRLARMKAREEMAKKRVERYRAKLVEKGK